MVRTDVLRMIASYCLRNVDPDGWLDPWIAEWHVTQLRANRRLLLCTTLLS